MREVHTQEEPEGLAGWLHGQSLLARSLLAALFLGVGTASLVIGRLATLTGDGAAWVVRMLLLEPVGVLAILAGGIVAWPRSRLSAYVSAAVARRRYASALGVILALGAILEGVRWFTRQAVLTFGR